MTVARLTRDELDVVLPAAGWCLIRLRISARGPGLRANRWMVPVGDPTLAYGYNEEPVTKLRPTGLEISMMDEVYGWLTLLPPDQFVLRRIISLRMLWDDDNGRNWYTWGHAAQVIGCDRRAIAYWHELAVRKLLLLVNHAPSNQSRWARVWLDREARLAA